jgi:hypothetical protein
MAGHMGFDHAGIGYAGHIPRMLHAVGWRQLMRAYDCAGWLAIVIRLAVRPAKLGLPVWAASIAWPMLPLASHSAPHPCPRWLTALRSWAHG